MKPFAHLRKSLARRSRHAGTAPGEAIPSFPERAEETRISAFVWDAERVEEFEVKTADQALEIFQRPGIRWFDVDGLGDVALIQDLCAKLNVHPLIVEDIVNTDQRPKVEDYGDVLFIILSRLSRAQNGHGFTVEQVSIVLGKNFILSFGEGQSDEFAVLREYLRGGKKRVNLLNADYVAYRLIDQIVDAYYPVLEDVGEKLDELEIGIVEAPDPEILPKVFAVKHELVFLRKSVWPLREAIMQLLQIESSLLNKPMRMYYRDVYDHLIQVMDMVETFREMQSSLLDMYMSSLGYRQNEVMKTLAIIATIFLPLTFLAGIWGMNFQHMPELGWRIGYGIALCIMAAIAVSQLIYFKRKKWL